MAENLHAPQIKVIRLDKLGMCGWIRPLNLQLPVLLFLLVLLNKNKQQRVRAKNGSVSQLPVSG